MIVKAFVRRCYWRCMWLIAYFALRTIYDS